MDFNFFEEQFKAAVAEIPKQDFDNSGLKLSVDLVLNSIALKIYKPEWSSNLKSPLEAESRIFFSIWINEKAFDEGKIYYNIHAFKLRDLKGYKIAGREFAEQFRTEFLIHQKDWENVAVNFGPLTLMQGWIELKNDSVKHNLIELSQKFLKISSIIDNTLELYKSR